MSKLLEPTTPYMLRRDGSLLECGSVHPYLARFEDEDDDAIFELDDLDLQWFMDNTKDEETKKLIPEFRKTGSREAFKKIVELTNNEFCKVRTSNHKYNYGGDNGEIYFRLCNTDNFNWYDIIWNVVFQFRNGIQNVTIMRDYDTFGKQFDYCNIKGTPIKHIPVDEFLTMKGNPVLEAKEKIRYYYNGPLYRFESVYRSEWEGYTEAVSEKQAINNLNQKAKKEFGFTPDAKLNIDPKYLEVSIKHPNEDDFKDVEPIKYCDNCGTRLNDAGECPNCDLGDESVLEEGELNTMNKSEQIENFIEDLYDLRKESIATEGEYGLGNLVFKEFRNLGYLDNLKELRKVEKGKELSLEKLEENQ